MADRRELDFDRQDLKQIGADSGSLSIPCNLRPSPQALLITFLFYNQIIMKKMKQAKFYAT
jgi:hypothetical protein